MAGSNRDLGLGDRATQRRRLLGSELARVGPGLDPGLQDAHAELLAAGGGAARSAHPRGHVDEPEAKPQRAAEEAPLARVPALCGRGVGLGGVQETARVGLPERGRDRRLVGREVVAQPLDVDVVEGREAAAADGAHERARRQERRDEVRLEVDDAVRAVRPFDQVADGTRVVVPDLPGRQAGLEEAPVQAPQRAAGAIAIVRRCSAASRASSFCSYGKGAWKAAR